MSKKIIKCCNRYQKASKLWVFDATQTHTITQAIIICKNKIIPKVEKTHSEFNIKEFLKEKAKK